VSNLPDLCRSQRTAWAAAGRCTPAWGWWRTLPAPRRSSCRSSCQRCPRAAECSTHTSGKTLCPSWVLSEQQSPRAPDCTGPTAGTSPVHLMLRLPWWLYLSTLALPPPDQRRLSIGCCPRVRQEAAAVIGCRGLNRCLAICRHSSSTNIVCAIDWKVICLDNIYIYKLIIYDIYIYTHVYIYTVEI